MVSPASWTRLYLYAAMGGMLGSLMRYGVAVLGPAMTPGGFPWSSLVVNVLGSLLIGWLLAVSQPEGRWPMSSTWQAFWLAGVCGGFTTFSFFSRDLALLLYAEAWLMSAAYLASSLSGWLLAVWLGYKLGKQLYKP
jgi:fluoride exporter